MSKFTTFTKTVTAAAFGAALMSGAAVAQMADVEEQAAQIEQELAVLPQYDGHEGPIVVTATEDGRIELTGMVDDFQQMQEIQDALDGMEGVDMDLVDNNIVQQ